MASIETMNVPELQHDLQRKYRNGGSRIEAIWRNFTPIQREKAMRGIIDDGGVPRTSRMDPAFAGFQPVVPEWNLEDMASTAEFFLDRLKFRVEADLHRQHAEGANGDPGDRGIIDPIACMGSLDSWGHKGQFAVFTDLGKYYGRWVTPTVAERIRGLEVMAARSELILPTTQAWLLLKRQTTIYFLYCQLIEGLLQQDFDSRGKAAELKKTATTTVNAMAKLTIVPQPQKASIAEAIVQAVDHKVSSEEYLEFLRSEPVVLTHAVRMTHLTRPELVPDNDGRTLPMFTDRYVSYAFFEVMTEAAKVVVTWDYIVRLSRMLDTLEDKTSRLLIAQELSNACHLEYRRAQAAFQRQMAIGVASKCFRRITTGDTHKTAIKGQASDYTVSDPQLHYILRLCHPDTSHTNAAQWIQKLDDHNTRYSDDLQRLAPNQVIALGNLAIIVSFMHTLSTALVTVPKSKKSGLLFTGRTTELGAKLAQCTAKADFGDYLVPADNLLQPGTIGKALEALDEFIIERAGASLGSLYEDVLYDCLTELEQKISDAENRSVKTEGQQSYVPLPLEEAKPASLQLEQRREKAKTRPTNEARAYDITAIAPQQLDPAVLPSPRIRVKASTASVFHVLFARSEARGSVDWADFAAAMANIGFSVTPKGGSVFTFNPPESVGGQPITLHRPHASEIEGWKLLIISRRLRRRYGWSEETFEVE